jgi:hypothetical protein
MFEINKYMLTKMGWITYSQSRGIRIGNSITFTKPVKPLEGVVFEDDPLYEQVKEYFPFHHISHMYIWESVREVYPHRDQTFFWNCPTEFRVMLHDDNDTPTLYVSDIENGDSHFVDTTNLDTNSFCWSNGSQIHGSDYFGKRKQLLCINGFLSVSKLDALLERSVNKYKDQLNYKLDINL